MAFPQAELVDGEQAMRAADGSRHRRRSRPLRRALRVAEAGLARAVAELAPGTTEKSLAGALLGSRPQAASAPRPRRTPPGSPPRNILGAAVPVMAGSGRATWWALAAGVLADGYVAEVARTLPVGELSDAARALYRRRDDLWDRMIDACRPGRPAAALLAAYEDSGEPLPAMPVAHGLGPASTRRSDPDCRETAAAETPRGNGPGPSPATSGSPGAGAVFTRDAVHVTSDGAEVPPVRRGETSVSEPAGLMSTGLVLAERGTCWSDVDSRDRPLAEPAGRGNHAPIREGPGHSDRDHHLRPSRTAERTHHRGAGPLRRPVARASIDDDVKVLVIQWRRRRSGQRRRPSRIHGGAGRRGPGGRRRPASPSTGWRSGGGHRPPKGRQRGANIGQWYANPNSGIRGLQDFKKIRYSRSRVPLRLALYQAADADLVISSDDAVFGHPSFRYHGWGPRMWVVGPDHGHPESSRKWSSPGRPFTAAEMFDCNFLNAVVPACGPRGRGGEVRVGLRAQPAD